MAQLAIKGHATRGREVIEILEMLGGKNPYRNGGKYISQIYFINNEGDIQSVCSPLSMLDFTVLTLEEVEALMPYQIGDKVIHEDEMCEIIGMKWHKRLEKIVYDAKSEKFTFSIFEPDKFTLVVNNEEFQNKLLKIYPDGETGHIQLIPHEDYEIKEINGDFVIIKKQSKYPKTFKECCATLGYENREISFDTHTCKFDTFFENFYKLYICRCAYWKIAGEQMGLNKPWSPDYTEESYEQGSPIKYVIYYTGTHIDKGQKCTPSYILSFPTKEIRDAFYENFKELIEKCKELL